MENKLVVPNRGGYSFRLRFSDLNYRIKLPEGKSRYCTDVRAKSRTPTIVGEHLEHFCLSSYVKVKHLVASTEVFNILCVSTYPPKKLFQHLWYQMLVIFGWVQSPFSSENIRSSLESNLIIPGLMAEFPVPTQVYGSQGRGLLSFSVPYRETPIEKCIVWYIQGWA